MAVVPDRDVIPVTWESLKGSSQDIIGVPWAGFDQPFALSVTPQYLKVTKKISIPNYCKIYFSTKKESFVSFISF